MNAGQQRHQHEADEADQGRRTRQAEENVVHLLRHVLVAVPDPVDEATEAEDDDDETQPADDAPE